MPDKAAIMEMRALVGQEGMGSNGVIMATTLQAIVRKNNVHSLCENGWASWDVAWHTGGPAEKAVGSTLTGVCVLGPS